MNKINIFTKCACTLIGWNPTILAECGEASYRTLKKYMSAILILSIIWGSIGYLFADRYIGLDSTLPKAIIAGFFIVIITCIERFIILKLGKAKLTGIMRFVLAILMATLGATIFDQIIFKNDVEVKLKESREEMANKAIKRRTIIINEETASLKQQRDSVQKELLHIYEQISAKPVITTISSVTTKIPDGINEDGTPKYKNQIEIKKDNIENPLNSQKKIDEEIIKKLDSQIDTLTKEKLNLSERIHEEYKNAKVGFLEELNVLFKYIIFQDSIATVFYVCLFLFMMSLELLVVSSKMGEDDCDYDLLVEQQLKIKSNALKKAQEKLAL